MLDVFQSGDDILLIEGDGRIKSMKKAGNAPAETKRQEGNDKKSDKKSGLAEGGKVARVRFGELSQ